MTEKAIRLAVLLISGGVGSAASVGTLLHMSRLKEQALAEHHVQSIQTHPTPAPTLTLKNGARLDGHIIASTNAWVKIRVPELGELTIPREQIAAIGAPVASRPQQASDYKPVRISRYGTSEESVAKAQRDLEYTIRHNAPKEEIERLRQVVRINKKNLETQEEARKQAEERRKAEEQRKAALAAAKTVPSSGTKKSKQPKIGETATTLGELSTPIGELGVQAKYTRIPQVRSSPAATAPSTVRSEPDLNQLSGEALYSRIVDSNGVAAGAITEYHFDGRSPTTRTFTTEERDAAQKRWWEEQKKRAKDAEEVPE